MWISLIKHSTCNANGFLYPLQTKFGRIYMNHLVHWLMQLCTVHIFIMELHFTQRLYITWWCFKILTQDHLGKFMVTGSKSALFVSGLCLSYGETLEISTSHKYKDVPWFWTKVIHARSRSMEVKVHNFCLLYTFLMGTHCKFLLHTKIADGVPWPCLRSFVPVQEY